MPPPIGSQSLLCRGVAARSRGNHTKGTDRVRPSSRTTVSEWSEHDTSTAKASLLSTKVGIPFLQAQASILQHELSNCGQFVTSKATVRCQCHRFEPELRITPGVRHMNVWWLTILQTVEEEPVTADPEQCRHGLSVLLGIQFSEACGLSACLATAPHHQRRFTIQERRLVHAVLARLLVSKPACDEQCSAHFRPSGFWQAA